MAERVPAAAEAGRHANLALGLDLGSSGARLALLAGRSRDPRPGTGGLQDAAHPAQAVAGVASQARLPEPPPERRDQARPADTIAAPPACPAAAAEGQTGLVSVPADCHQLWEATIAYPGPFDAPMAWRQALIQLAAAIPAQWRQRIGAIAIDGTSGTLLLCGPEGELLAGPLRRALPYHQACVDQAAAALAIAGGGPAGSASSSLARALSLLQTAASAGEAGPWLLRHQADWLMGWLLGDWRWGEEGNNLRLGWDLRRQAWSGTIGLQPWAAALPAIRPSGQVLGRLCPEAASALGLPLDCRVVSGSTDANAGVLAADPADGDGVAVLGTTLVLKRFVDRPIEGPGISCHRVGGRWLAGGASNAGAGILRRFFDDAQIALLSRQIDPARPSGLRLRPLPGRGERFPIDDPELEPVLGPRPVSDALYLQALLEGLTALEVAGWRRLRELGAPPVQRVISIGGGARNPQWRRMRQQALAVPVLNRPRLSAARGMALLALRALERADQEGRP